MIDNLGSQISISEIGNIDPSLVHTLFNELEIKYLFVYYILFIFSSAHGLGSVNGRNEGKETKSF